MAIGPSQALHTISIAHVVLRAIAVSPPHLLQIVPSLDGGSLARATLDAAQAAIAAGGSATVASAGGMLLPQLLRMHIKHVDLVNDRNPLWARWSLPTRLFASLHGVEVSVVQGRTPLASWIGQSVARRLKVKCIATLHQPFVGASRVERFVERRQTQADAVVAVSDHIARDTLARLPDLADKLDTIKPGINLDRFDPAAVRAERVIRLAAELHIPDDCHVILCAARDEPGRLTLIQAIKQLGRNDVFCLLLGQAGSMTPFEKELERQIVQADLLGRVQIGPYVEDMPAAYMLADVVVATGGTRRGFSRTLLEANAMGRPVIAEEGGGAAESVRPGITGWLAALADSGSLAKAIETALSLSAERRAELARAAQDHVRRNYSLTRSNQRLLALYERLSGGD
jgi:glycosyltransferase involved in cell wall biosynthesis